MGLTPEWSGNEHAVARVTDAVQEGIESLRRARSIGDVFGEDGRVGCEVSVEESGLGMDEIGVAGEAFWV